MLLGALRADAVDLLQALGRLLDDVEHLFAEGLHQLLGVDRADALDHAGGEVLLDALGRGRRRRAQEIGAELHAVRPVVDPPAARLDELAGADRRRMADDGDQIALAARLHPQHAEAAVLVVEGDALDEARQDFTIGLATFISTWSFWTITSDAAEEMTQISNAACLRPEHAAAYNPSPR